MSLDTPDPFDSLRERAAKAPPPTCGAAIHRECTQDLAPCRSFSRRARVVAGFLVVALVFAAFLSSARRPLGGFGAAALFGAAGWALIQLVILFLSFGRKSVPSNGVRFLVLLCVPLAFLGYLTLGNSGHLPLSEFLNHSDESHHVLHCGLISFATGAFAALGILLLWRRTDPFTPRLSGALAGLIGGMAAAIPIGLICPGKECWHLWLGHGLSLLAVIGVGAVLGRKWLSP